jgi:hypothetical protein
MNEPGKVLQGPKAMKPLSANMKPEEAYVTAIGNLSVAITTLVEGIISIETRLDEIGAELAILSRYAQRKGEADSIWKPEDEEMLSAGGEDAGAEQSN